MVEGEAQIAHRPDGDAICPIDGEDHGAFLNGTHTQDAGIGLIDDGHREQAPGDAMVGDGEGATLDLVRSELSRSSALGQVGDGPLQAAETQHVCVLNDRDDQSRIQRHGHTDVDMPVQKDALIGEAAIGLGHCLQSFDNGLDEEGGEGQLEPFSLLKLGLVILAVSGYTAHVGFHHCGSAG